MILETKGSLFTLFLSLAIYTLTPNLGNNIAYFRGVDIQYTKPIKDNPLSNGLLLNCIIKK